MATKRNDGRYQKNITLGDGNRKTITAKSLKELKEKENEIRNQLAKGIDIVSQTDTLKQWAERTYQIKQAQMTAKEYKTFKFRCEYFVQVLGKLKLNQIKQIHIQPMIDSLFIENPTSNKPSSAKTLLYYSNALSQIFEYAIENRVTDYNPCKYVRIPKNAPKSERRAITPEERIWINETEDIMQIPAMLALYCGLRRGEISALQFSDIDYKQNTIRINKSVNLATNEIKCPKTESGNRLVPIPDILINKLINIPKKSTYVCTDKKGKPLNESSWRRLWKKYLHKLDSKYGMVKLCDSDELTIEPFTLHCLRHTYATILYSAGVDVKSAKELLGHSDVTTTLKIYTHLEKTTKTKSITKLNEFLSTEKNVGTN